MPDIITDKMVLVITLAMPTALLIAAAILAKTSKSRHG
jgi:hypothetical protein